ncbi:MAG TPA: ABC transporter ATP-binding protein [Acidimicrobiales bacterium]|nr:ABC transporter ATP-binding protein [Acidimicrobiales bacterium]
MPIPPVLSARDLVKTYDSDEAARNALDGVSFDVEDGSFVSIMGPSGSGKSTLLHLLGGLDSPTSGEVLLDGTSLSTLSDDALTLVRRKRIGFVFQFFNLVPVLTVAENVALPAVIAGESPAEYGPRRDEVIELVGLGDHRDKLPAEVSGGQQQRVAVARALFVAPAVLLADEPTGNLDSVTGREILDLLRTAQTERGQTIVLVTHDPAAAAVGDELVQLRDGRISDRLHLKGTHAARTRQVLASLRADASA